VIKSDLNREFVTLVMFLLFMLLNVFVM